MYTNGAACHAIEQVMNATVAGELVQDCAVAIVHGVIRL